ncbi:MAG TPA: TrmH family RNA methyltransferase [Candidatus Saccharimonadales bacterium]|nr:TrmH family RNA methyltransferase [Candidatus Saccharimonadales bacterium]
MPEIIVLAHNIRSTHNVGATFRTAEGFGVSRIILSGYTPYPRIPNDTRLPHITEKLTTQIHKTALGAEQLVPFTYQEAPRLKELSASGYRIVGLEQSPQAIMLPSYIPTDKIVLILGEEVEGIPGELIDMCDDLIEIPMHGKKESYNVSVATGIALYALTTN